MDDVAGTEDGLDAIDKVENAAVFLGEGVEGKVADKAADGFLRIGFDGEGKAVNREDGVEFFEGDAGLGGQLF